MKEEMFFSKPSGKIVFNCHKSVGVDDAVDCTKTYRRMAQHFYSGDGWPVNKPSEVDHCVIWNSFAVPVPEGRA